MTDEAQDNRARAAAAFDELENALRAHDDAQWDYALAPEGTKESSEAYEVATSARTRLEAAIDALRVMAGASARRTY